MPFDGTGFETKPETVTEPWRKVLMDAADYIEAHGWCQGTGGKSSGGPVCAWVATTAVARRTRTSVIEADKRFAEFIGVYDPCFIPDWNDTPGRTASEVTAALRECARS